ncbi:thiamine diphosphokinase [Dysgonomonas sp. Marseille-P4677]|uniref:thiamine diphosphokinase n=1 Tax=Dysgonomonas sp. Marseille-P4677 TaxID=2364790 RepID=UPI001911C5CC|nr:thiamine diphosphokinase [Dysgonomonas sp. Marseille-P4677]MBK5722619.1 thiamine diphosphokinase [Dysgonomonas sp. Marseille-P4677]
MKRYKLPNINQQADTVILANGEFPKHPITSSILNNCKYLVCCDGAINNLVKTNKEPNAIVGDCDSLSEENRVKYASIIHRIREQETNDLTKAVHFCLKQEKRKITILGATGKREDHTIANISLLCEYMQEAEVEMITDYGIFNGIESDSIFDSQPKQQVSIMSIDRNAITSENLVYKIENQIFTNWWQATLNEAEGNEFEIKTSGRTIVYRAFL